MINYELSIKLTFINVMKRKINRIRIREGNK